MNLFNFAKIKNNSILNSMNSTVKLINKYFESYKSYSDEELKNFTKLFKDRLQNGENLNNILPEAFALVKEASRRILQIVHFDEQIKAGIAKHNGHIVEMKTGEGKTLAATLSAYLNALQVKVHIATVNDYLAKRDAEEMSKIYNFLGLTCGSVLEQSSNEQKKIIYSYDIVYGTGSQFGFDYLRDNQKYEIKDLCMQSLDFIIIDEVDRLLDDGSTPLIISEQANDEQDLSVFEKSNELVKNLKESHLELDKKNKTVYFTDDGIKFVNNFLQKKGYIGINDTLFSNKYKSLVHAIHKSLTAHYFFNKNYDYIVHNKEIKLIDQMTGRILISRSYSDGLQQALQAKENLQLEKETHIVGTINLQKYYNLYKKLTGMSGTCFDESEEFKHMFNTIVVQIPTHLPIKRIDLPDRIYNTLQEKTTAIIKEIKSAHLNKQPVLLITNSIESSEYFAIELKKNKLDFLFLNAKNVQEEAEIIANAGKPGAIVIATNMAGRGTDIQLGGNFAIEVQKLKDKGISGSNLEQEKNKIKEKILKDREIVLNAGGLLVIGAERNENARVDLQARGRSGRQGDPGKSIFFISLDDDLVKRFVGVDQLRKTAEMFNLFTLNEEIDDSTIRNQIVSFQKECEAMESENRRYFIKYENIEDLQRKVFYKFRNDVLKNIDLNTKISNIIKTKNPSFDSNNIDFSNYRFFYLMVLDTLWKKFLKNIDEIKDGINLLSSAEKDIFIEYQKRVNEEFKKLLNEFNESIFKKHEEFVNQNINQNNELNAKV